MISDRRIFTRRISTLKANQSKSQEYSKPILKERRRISVPEKQQEVLKENTNELGVDFTKSISQLISNAPDVDSDDHDKAPLIHHMLVEKLKNRFRQKGKCQSEEECLQMAQKAAVWVESIVAEAAKKKEESDAVIVATGQGIQDDTILQEKSEMFYDAPDKVPIPDPSKQIKASEPAPPRVPPSEVHTSRQPSMEPSQTKRRSLIKIKSTDGRILEVDRANNSTIIRVPKQRLSSQSAAASSKQSVPQTQYESKVPTRATPSQQGNIEYSRTSQNHPMYPEYDPRGMHTRFYQWEYGPPPHMGGSNQSGFQAPFMQYPPSTSALYNPPNGGRSRSWSPSKQSYRKDSPSMQSQGTRQYDASKYSKDIPLGTPQHGYPFPSGEAVVQSNDHSMSRNLSRSVSPSLRSRSPSPMYYGLPPMYYGLQSASMQPGPPSASMQAQVSRSRLEQHRSPSAQTVYRGSRSPSYPVGYPYPYPHPVVSHPGPPYPYPYPVGVSSVNQSYKPE